LPDAPRVDARADGVDHAGAVLVRDPQAVERALCGAVAGLGIGRVDGRDLHPDADLAGAGIGPVDLLNGEDVARGSDGGVGGSSHVPRLPVGAAPQSRHPLPDKSPKGLH
jgi:hypothetical protein